MKNLIVETTSRCNLTCSMCLRHSWKDHEGDMEFDVFRRLLPAFPDLDSLNLSGYGEPFLHPRLVDMVRTAREALPAHAVIQLVSNATLLDRRAAREVIGAGLNRVTLSLDTLSAEAFPSVRGGAALESVTACLETLAELRNELPQHDFSIELSMVGMKRNIRELPDLVRFAADRQVDTIWVNNILPYTEALTAETLYGSHSEEVLALFAETMASLRQKGLGPERLRSAISKLFSLRTGPGGSMPEAFLSEEEDLLLGLARRLASVRISMGGIYQKIIELWEGSATTGPACAEIFEESGEIAGRNHLTLHLPLLVPRARRECDFIRNQTCFVTWDGWVRPCNQLSHDYNCFHHGRPKSVRSVSFGRVQDQDLRTIWDSRAYREFREKVSDFPFSPCGDCGLADGCGYISADADFSYDCNFYDQPCGDCLWSRGILRCP